MYFYSFYVFVVIEVVNTHKLLGWIEQVLPNQNIVIGNIEFSYFSGVSFRCLS